MKVLLMLKITTRDYTRTAGIPLITFATMLAVGWFSIRTLPDGREILTQAFIVIPICAAFYLFILILFERPCLMYGYALLEGVEAKRSEVL